MRSYTCIIVDDEPLARNVLEEYISLLPNLQLQASCRNAGEAIAILQHSKTDLIFCDIKMPGVNGLQFLRSLYQPPKIIVTTAYREYAVEGFDIGVADYLLKPIPLERFLLAVNRALGIEEMNKNSNAAAAPEFAFFKTGNTTERVMLNNIDYITAYGNYCKIHLPDSKRVLAVNYKISELETLLKTKKFIRVHKSYIVNQQHVSKLSSATVFVNSAELPIGESYKKSVFELLGTI
jgi:two-component system LytT family response regulator